MDAAVSEYLSGTVFFAIGETNFGQSGTGGAPGADETIVEVRSACADWTVPKTELTFRMGLQGVVVPSPCPLVPWQSPSLWVMTLPLWPSPGSSRNTQV